MKKLIPILALVVLIAFAASCRFEGHSVTPGYTREETGHWERTGIKAFTDGKNASVGSKENSLTWSFPDGGQLVIEPYWFEEKYYDSESISAGINLILTGSTAEKDDAVCSVFFAYDEAGEVPLGSFKDAYQGYELSRFSFAENSTVSDGYTDGIKHYVSPRASFPKTGSERTDGEVIYIVITSEAMDCTSRIVFEYKWVAQPETVEVPEQIGPTEYYFGCP